MGRTASSIGRKRRQPQRQWGRKQVWRRGRAGVCGAPARCCVDTRSAAHVLPRQQVRHALASSQEYTCNCFAKLIRGEHCGSG